MATIRLTSDFKDFLRLLNENKVEYLLVGGYAVGYYGYPRATADIDIWVALNSINAKKIVTVIKKFGFNPPQLSEALFLTKGKIIRMGIPPFRIEILTEISGVDFDASFLKKTVQDIDGVMVNLISLDDLKVNKKASGRFKDLDDLENLEEV